MLKLEGILAFVTTVEAGSISAAARRLGFASSVISERLAELERSLGAKLVQRSTRRLALTEDGHTFLPRAHRILQETQDAAAEIAERKGTLVGSLRLSAPVSFGILHLGAAITTFLRNHPALQIDLDLDDRFVDATADGFDAVLRHGPVTDSMLVAKRIARSRRLLVAAPHYLAAHGTPATPDELACHCAILYTNRDSDWRFLGRDGWVVVRPRPSLRVNNGLVMRDAALAGLGICLLPSFFLHQEIKSGALISLDIGMEAEAGEVFLAYHRDRGANAKIAALVDSLRSSFGDPPYWDLPQDSA